MPQSVISEHITITPESLAKQGIPGQNKEKQIMTQYSEKSYKMASDNTKYNDDGKAVISENDEWRDEKEWDEVFEQMQKERQNL